MQIFFKFYKIVQSNCKRLLERSFATSMRRNKVDREGNYYRVKGCIEESRENATNCTSKYGIKISTVNFVTDDYSTIDGTRTGEAIRVP